MFYKKKYGLVDLTYSTTNMGLRIKNFNILGVHWKIRILGKHLGERSRKNKREAGIS